MTTKVAIVGSRYFPSETKCKQFIVQNVIKDRPNLEFVSGGAIGVDSWAYELYEQSDKVTDFKLFKPDWDKHGKKAGFLRNVEIIDYADEVYAFWDSTSRGTKHSIDLAFKAGKLVKIVLPTVTAYRLTKISNPKLQDYLTHL